MTDQTYKLVPMVPTEEMEFYAEEYKRKARTGWHWGGAYRAMIDAAPEPVCKWYFVGTGFETGCDHCMNHYGIPEKPFLFCPHCGKKVEVVDNE